MGTPLLTFCIPVANYHTHLIDRALQQVNIQTIKCEVSVYIDVDSKGAGYSRNRAVEKANTPFVAFLDCDDFLDATYAEKMLSVYKPGHYVYSDWFMAGELIKMAECSNLKDDEAHHLVTCVIHRDIFWQVGGFDEVRNMEDSRFYAKALHHGVCGIRCPHPLVEYTGEGQRSRLARSDPSWAREYWSIFREYPSMCSCNGAPKMADMGTRYDGDVLAVATWGGNRGVRGRITGRQYPRTGNYMELWIDPRDAEAQPDMFQIVPEPVKPEPNIDIIKELAAARLNKVIANEPAPEPISERANPMQPTAPKPSQPRNPQRTKSRKPSAGNRRAG